MRAENIYFDANWFVLSESRCSPSSSSDRIFSTVAHRHHVNQHTPVLKTYVKRGDYPDHQRQRHRTESAAGVVIPANSNALTPTSCCSASTSANSAVAFRVSPNTGRRHTKVG
uniref:Uncharacterized protein n=1 Tax=Ditylenchus dipsaci TaxID=166011 RepID=A0A915ET88_9BILA